MNIQCPICNKKMKTAQGLQGHIHLKHNNTQSKQEHVNVISNTSLKKEKYPFGLTSQMHLDPSIRAGLMAGLANTPEELIEKIQRITERMIYEDPEFFKEFMHNRGKGQLTREYILKLFWFYQQEGMVTDIEDFIKKDKALGVIKETICPF